MLVERLLHGANLLDLVDPLRFNISLWHTEDDECGFSACAIGHFWHDKQFQEWGLSSRVGPLGVLIPCYQNTTYQGDAMPDVADLFDLTVGQADYLFYDRSYSHLNTVVTPAIVAARIREFVRTNGQSHKEWQEAGHDPHIPF